MSSEERWQHGFATLLAFVNENGHSRVPKAFVSPDEFQLGRWVGKQRAANRDGKLSADRVSKLEAIPGWTWTLRNAAWNSAWDSPLDELNCFVAEHGHALVPRQYVTASGVNLGFWVNRHRRSYLAGTMPQPLAEALESVPGWVWHNPRGLWDRRLATLRAFINEHGHSHVPQAFVSPDGFRLGLWVGTQRSSHRNGKLSPERIAQLEALPGWTWCGRDARWQKTLRELEGFVGDFGHARVPKVWTTPTGFRLGKAARRLRDTYVADKLPPAKVETLEALPGWAWHYGDANWWDTFEKLREYATRHGKARVPHEWRDDSGFWLGRWTHTQRVRHRDGSLPEDRVRALEALPGWSWDGERSSWPVRVTEIRRYAAEYGVVDPPRGFIAADGRRLHSHVQYLRKGYRDGTLSPERIAELEAIPGWAWDRDGIAWQRGLFRLRAYAAANGTADVPQHHVVPETGYLLGAWVRRQKRRHRDGKLSPERVAQLESLPGWTWGQPLSAGWEHGFAELLRHVEVKGTAAVPSGYVVPETGYQLGHWASNQRNRYRDGKLSPKRTARLEALPGWTWNVIDAKWERGFAEMLRHVEVKGTADVPSRHVVPETGYPLGQWVSTQRNRYRKGKLSPERIARLEALPGWRWARSRARRGPAHPSTAT